MGFITPYVAQDTPFPQGEIHIGVDIGQKVDPTAIVVVETVDRQATYTREAWEKLPDGSTWSLRRGPTHDTHYMVRHIERIPLNTSYPDVARRLVEMLIQMRLLEIQRRTRGIDDGSRYARRTLYADITGVGRPVLDILHDAIRGHSMASDCAVAGITFTHGDKYDRKKHSMGKAYLVSRLQVLLQTQRVKLPAGHPEAAQMARELLDYEIRVSEDTGTDTYGAFKVGTHDDLATALGLACLEDPRDYRASYMPNPYAS